MPLKLEIWDPWEADAEERVECSASHANTLCQALGGRAGDLLFGKAPPSDSPLYGFAFALLLGSLCDLDNLLVTMHKSAVLHLLLCTMETIKAPPSQGCCEG